MMKCLAPERLGEARVMEDSTHTLNEPVIKGFSDAIVLRGVMCGETMLRALLLKECGEFIASELTASVRA